MFSIFSAQNTYWEAIVGQPDYVMYVTLSDL